MLKIISTIALLTWCVVPPNGAKRPFGQAEMSWECLRRIERNESRLLMAKINLEFEAAAIGTHAVQWADDSSGATAEGYRVIAESATKLWFRLTSCQRVNQILTEAMVEVVCAANNNTVEGDTAKLYFDNVDSFLRNDPAVGRAYKRMKEEASSASASAGPSTNATSENAKNRSDFPAARGADDRAANNLFVFERNSMSRTTVLHAYFVALYDSPGYVRGGRAREEETLTCTAIVELSSDPQCGDAVQRLYDETVAEVARTLSAVVKENASKSDDYLPGVSEDAFVAIFFDRLHANVRKNADVRVKFDATKGKIRAAVPRINQLSVQLPWTGIVGTALLAEMTANSVGTHFFQTDDDPNADKRRHVVAESALKLLLQLATFDKVLGLLSNFWESTTYTTLYADKVDRLLEEDPSVGPKYKAIKRDTENEISLPSAAAAADHFEKTKIPGPIFENEKELTPFFYALLKRNKVARTGYLHFLFVGEWKEFNMTPADRAKNATAKAIAKLSTNPKYADRVQQLYDETISASSENMLLLMRDDYKMQELTNVVSDNLFKSVSMAFQKDAELATELEKIKRTYLSDRRDKI